MLAGRFNFRFHSNFKFSNSNKLKFNSGIELKLVFILNLVWWIAEIKPASPNETNSGSIKIESLLLISDFGFSRQNGNQIQEIQTFNLMAGIVSVTETGQSIH